MRRTYCHQLGWLGGIGWLLAAMFLSVGTAVASPTIPSRAVQAKITAATFEVVRAKPASDPLTYATPLPIDQLPPGQRNDRYNSIGYAAAIGDGRYVTATSLLYDGPDSLWGPPELRDSEGHVYAIDKIVKLVLPYGLAVFTLSTAPGSTAALPMNSEPLSGTPLYVLGAQAGNDFELHPVQYTTTTPAKEGGHWQWIRFTADARPKAGPLLNQAGDIVGVVNGVKPAGRNGYYALPIDQVANASTEMATLDNMIGYRIPILGPGIETRFHVQFDLPESVAAFNAQFTHAERAFRDRQLQTILARPSSQFTVGPNAYNILYGSPLEIPAPTFLALGKDGSWGLWKNQTATRDLPDGAVMQASKYGTDILFRLRLPSPAAVAQLHRQPDLLMRNILAALPTYRTVGSTRVAIKSLGTPTLSIRRTDQWQRPWNVWVWPLAYKNFQVSVIALPVPDGYAGILSTMPTADMRTQLTEMEALANFFYATYSGTFPQWKNFLSERNELPKVLQDMSLQFDAGKSADIDLPNVQIDCPATVLDIDAETLMSVVFGYGAGQSQPELGVRALHLVNNGQSTVEYARTVQPPANAGDAFQTNWKQLNSVQYPRSLVSPSKQGATQSLTSVAVSKSSPNELYLIAFGLAGKHDASEMKAKLGLLRQGFHVGQH